MKKLKWILPVLAIVFAVSFVVGGTMAWLIADTNPVVNVFTYGDINIELSEDGMEEVVPDDGSDPYYENEFKMLPGSKITKDPEVTVTMGSEDCWLFVELTETENFDDFMEYTVDAGWEELDDVDGVYYREVTCDGEADQVFSVLKDHCVTVKDTVTKEMLNSLDEDPDAPAFPKLTITAYAVQRDAEIEAIDTAEEAWALANSESAMTH